METNSNKDTKPEKDPQNKTAVTIREHSAADTLVPQEDSAHTTNNTAQTSSMTSLKKDQINLATKRRHRSSLKMDVSGLGKEEGLEGNPNLPTPELKTFPFKLGWIQGVMIPCLLNIWGVMLFLRIAWVVAQAGIGFSLLIITLSYVVCMITTLSLSAIVSNGRVEGGGVYYLVSRSLGAELGASVGIIFAFANAVAASMNTIGFCDSLNDLLRRYSLKILDGGVNDIRIVGAITLLFLCVICAIGMDWESKFQNFLIVIIVLAIFNYILGVLIGPMSDTQRAQGFTGLKLEVAKRNWKPDFRVTDGVKHEFFSVFAIYFPAVTGVQAGANICGDLKDPTKAIPKGTVAAVSISTITYVIMTLGCGCAGLRDASGDVTHPYDHNKLSECKPSCKYGLHNNYEMMQLMAAWDLLIFFGCWAATLSTALTNLLAVPRLIQALGKDQVYPGLKIFAKPYGRYGEPYRGYVLVYLISVSFLLIADLNTIAPLITNFYLASYALINFCAFHADFIKHISWRPQFRYHNKWLCLFGFILCLSIMMIISWKMALITVLLFLALYLFVIYRKPTNVKWGSSTEAQKYRDTVEYLVNLTMEHEVIKSYNPQLLVMTGRPYLNPLLLNVGNLITKLGSFMIVADVEITHLTSRERVARYASGQKWLNSHKYRSFYVVIDGHSLDTAVSALIQCAGLGRLSPNIFLIGFLHGWQKKNASVIETYFRALQNAYDNHVSLAILRSGDIESTIKSKQSLLSGSNRAISETSEFHDQVKSVLRADSDEISDSLTATYPGDFLSNKKNMETDDKNIHSDARRPGSSPEVPFQNKLLENKFQSTTSMGDKKQLLQSVHLGDGRIDAWWLFDDGGLNILIPYIISRRGYKNKIPLRIFSIAKTNNDTQAYSRLEAVLASFRIEYEELRIFSISGIEPLDKTWNIFNNLVTYYKSENTSDIFTSNEELRRLRKKTGYYLRIRDLLVEHCSDSSLVIVTLPLPKKVSAYLYMIWLEVLSLDLPTLLFIRGNQASVLDT